MKVQLQLFAETLDEFKRTLNMWKKALSSIGIVSLLCSSVYAEQNKCLRDIEHQNNPGIVLNLPSCMLSARDMQKVVAYVDQHREIIYLNVNNNPIGNEGAKYLAALSNLRYLEASFTGISDKGAEDLARGLIGLEVLHLDGNNIGENGIIAINKLDQLYELTLAHNPISDNAAIALGHNNHFITLDVTDTQLSTKGAEAIARTNYIQKLMIGENNLKSSVIKILAKNPNINRLVISDVTRDDIKLLATSTIQSLYFYHSQLTAADASILAKDDQLRVLGIVDAPINDLGAAALATNKTLQGLYLVNAGISPRGAAELAKSNLLSLLLPYNHIQDAGVSYLAKKSFEILDLTANDIESVYGLDDLANDNIQFLYLDENKIGDKGAAVLKNLPNTFSLSLNDNNIGDEGAIALAQSGEALKYLMLAYNHIGVKGRDALHKNQNFWNINLTGNHRQLKRHAFHSRSIDRIRVEGSRFVLSAPEVHS